VRAGIAVFGEIGLTGRLRPATQADRRLEECAKLGLRTVVAPEGTPDRAGGAASKHTGGRSRDHGLSPASAPGTGTLQVTRAETLRQAIRAGLDDEQSAEGEQAG
jgi:DNA repair protein RadA/Sms